MYNIRTYNAISSKGLNRFPADKYTVSSESAAPDGVLWRSQKLHTEVLPESVLAVPGGAAVPVHGGAAGVGGSSGRGAGGRG